MRSLLLLLSLVTVAPCFAAPAVDLAQLNVVLKDIATQVLAADNSNFFTSLGASIDPTASDLSQDRLAGKVWVGVANSSWSSQPSTFETRLSLAKLSPIAADGKVSVQVELGAKLITQVLPFTNLILQKLAEQACSAAPRNLPSDVLNTTACDAFTKMSKAESTAELGADISALAIQIKAQTASQIAVIDAKLPTLSGDERANWEADKNSLIETQKGVNKLTIRTENGSTSISYGEGEYEIWQGYLFVNKFVLAFNDSAIELTLGVRGVQDQQSYAMGQQYLIQSLTQLSQADKATVDSYANFLKGYMDFAKEIVQNKP